MKTFYEFLEEKALEEGKFGEKIGKVIGGAIGGIGPAVGGALGTHALGVDYAPGGLAGSALSAFGGARSAVAIGGELGDKFGNLLSKAWNGLLRWFGKNKPATIPPQSYLDKIGRDIDQEKLGDEDMGFKPRIVNTSEIPLDAASEEMTDFINQREPRAVAAKWLEVAMSMLNKSDPRHSPRYSSRQVSTIARNISVDGNPALDIWIKKYMRGITIAGERGPEAAARMAHDRLWKMIHEHEIEAPEIKPVSQEETPETKISTKDAQQITTYIIQQLRKGIDIDTIAKDIESEFPGRGQKGRAKSYVIGVVQRLKAGGKVPELEVKKRELGFPSQTQQKSTAQP